MQKVFVDTDVIIDFLTDRKPYSEQAAIILSLSEYKIIQVCVSSLTFANCYYILKKYSSHTTVITRLSQLAEIVDIIDVDKKVILNSLKSGFKDFEDAIQNETAKSDEKIKILITRNIKDYQKSDLSIYTPELFLRSFQK
jgi:predicted nucleic acid-binding protein